MFPILVVMSFPHSWASDRTVSFETREDAVTFAEETRERFPEPQGHEGRCNIKIYELIKEVE